MHALARNAHQLLQDRQPGLRHQWVVGGPSLLALHGLLILEDQVAWRVDDDPLVGSEAVVRVRGFVRLG
jgi:hypothetical protein